MIEQRELQDMLSPSQAGRALNLSSQRVRQLLAEGRLPFLSTPLGRLVDPAAVEALRAEREQRASERA